MTPFVSHMALARATLKDDPEGAHRHAAAAFYGVAMAAFHGGDYVELASALRADPVLLFAFDVSRALRSQYQSNLRALQQIEAAQQAPLLGAGLLANHPHDIPELEPAPALLAQLEAGETLRLNGHSLRFERDFGALAGTNPYGCDYFAGRMEIATVEAWRKAMLKGEIWGTNPELPDDAGSAPHGGVATALGAAQAVLGLHAALASMEHMRFTKDLGGVCPAPSSPSSARPTHGVDAPAGDMASPAPRVCGTCHNWLSPQGGKSRGECRVGPPQSSGWPTTMAGDWCRSGWSPDPHQQNTESKQSLPSEYEDSRLAFNYVYIRDYPDESLSWLESVLAAPESIPPAFRAALADLLRGGSTGLLPISAPNGEDSCDGILVWAESLPGGNNDAPDDADWKNILVYVDEPDLWPASCEARDALASDHPWAVIAARVAAPAPQPL